MRPMKRQLGHVLPDLAGVCLSTPLAALVRLSPAIGSQVGMCSPWLGDDTRGGPRA